MPVAAIIEERLSQQNSVFGISEAVASDGHFGDVKTTIFQDQHGKLQALYSGDSILDVEALCRLTQRQLSVVSPAAIGSICDQLTLERLTTIPTVLGLELIVDQRLLDTTELTLDSGSKHYVITINNEQFRKLIGDAQTGTYTVLESELVTSSLEGINDVNQITMAIANFTQLRIKQRLQDTVEFPPMPETAQRILKLRINPDANIQDLTDIVESDPPLAAQVVSWAASPYYAAPGEIKSVHDAIVRVLGFDLVLNLALGLALGKTLSLPKDSAQGFTPYWEQAIYTATAIEALVGAIPARDRPNMGIAYLSGLLHNFGYLILAEVFPPYFSNICRYQEANPYSNHCHIERHLLGVDRDQLGSWLMRLWDMPEEVSSALRFQNDVEFDQQHGAYANLLFIAKRLLRKHGMGDAPLVDIPAGLYARLQLDPERAEDAIITMLESAEELEIMVSNLAA